jgi:hypothetical protein
MNEFDKLCNLIIETMLASGPSIFGSPADSPEVGSQGGKFGNANVNNKDTRIPYKMGKVKRRKLKNTM